MVEASISLKKLLIILRALAIGQFFFQIIRPVVVFFATQKSDDIIDTTLFPFLSFFAGSGVTFMWLASKPTVYLVDFGLNASIVMALVTVLQYILHSTLIRVLGGAFCGVLVSIVDNIAKKVPSSIEGYFLGVEIRSISFFLSMLLPMVILECLVVLMPNKKLLDAISTLFTFGFTYLLAQQFKSTSSIHYSQEIDAIAEDLRVESEKSTESDSQNIRKVDGS